MYIPVQGFVQVLFLTSVFHEGLSFIAVGHNSMCVSMLALCSWKLIWGTINPPCGIAPGSFGNFTNPSFSNSLSMHHLVISHFLFLELFLPL